MLCGSFLAVELSVKKVDANFFPTDLTISIKSPENKTYTSPSLFFDLSSSALDPLWNDKTSWIGYSLDGQANQSTTKSFFQKLVDVSEGYHKLEVYAQTNYTDPNHGIVTLNAYSIVYFTIDTAIPNIHLNSPSNSTYNSNSVPLSFFIDKPVSNFSYSLDSPTKQTITGNVTLTDLAEGSHCITVYADTDTGKTGASKTVYFSIKNTSPSPTPTAVSTGVPLEVVAAIEMGPSPTGVVYDSGKGEIFVANGGGRVSVISEENNRIVVNISVGVNPTGMAYDSVHGRVFVSNTGGNTISVISDSNYSVVATVPVLGLQPKGLAYDPVRDLLFVANYGSNTVSVISGANNTVIATITVGDKPVGVAYDFGKDLIFVANSHSPAGDSGPGIVTVISCSKVVASNPETPTDVPVVETIAVQGRPTEIAYDSGRGEIFAGGLVISDENNSVVASLFAPHVSPHSVAYASGKGTVFFAVPGDGLNLTVWAVSDETHEVTATLDLGYRGGSSGMAYSPTTEVLYVARGWQPLGSPGVVFAISASSFPSVSPTPTASSPLISVSPSDSLPNPSPSVPELTPITLLVLMAAVGLAVIARGKRREVTSG
jgi:YVTN family beta-propeller protein